MAMRAILKKISSSPQTRCCLMERTGVQRIHLYSTGNLEGFWNPKKNEVEDDDEDQQSNNRVLKSNLWVKSIHEVLYENKKKRKLKSHRLLLSMKIINPDKTYSYDGSVGLGGGTVEFTTASPHTGLLHSTNKLVVDRGPFELPTQAVNGLVCIVVNGAFLIYNPVTGDVSDWIQMPPMKNRRRIATIALGYSPKSDQYKVIRISETTSKKPDWVIEVMTLGENSTWRRIDAAQIKRVSPNLARTKGAKEEFLHGPFYVVNGFIHWRFKIYGGVQDIIEFNVESEEFKYLGIQKFALSPSFRLMEVHGRVAVVKIISAYEASFWVVTVERKRYIKWSEEKKIIMPYAWTVDPEFSIEALAGTNLILIKQERQNCIFCYDLETKNCRKFPISPDHDGPPHEWERIVQL